MVELVIHWKMKEEIGRENGFITDEETGTLIWDLDSFICLLDLQDSYEYYSGNSRYIESIDDVYEIKYLNHIVTLEKERLSIKRGVYYEVWGGKEPPKKDPRMEYTYHWTESGFVLDSVKPL